MTRQHIALWPRKAPIHCEVWGLPYERRCSSESMAEGGGALWRVRFLRTTTTLMRSSKDATNITARNPHSNPTAGRDSGAVRLAHDARSPSRSDAWSYARKPTHPLQRSFGCSGEILTTEEFRLFYKSDITWWLWSHYLVESLTRLLLFSLSLFVITVEFFKNI